jgi:hypothetical protein
MLRLSGGGNIPVVPLNKLSQKGDVSLLGAQKAGDQELAW